MLKLQNEVTGFHFMLYIPLSVSLLSLGFVLFLIGKLKRTQKGTPEIVEISEAISEGAKAFLKREFKTILIVFIVIAAFLWFLSRSLLGPTIFVIGGSFSYLAGFIGMMVSTNTNGRVAEASKESFPKSFRISFWGGEVMGFLVVGLGLLGVSLVWFFLHQASLLVDFALGASLVALFMRVGGGIYTKSADVGADLVGKIEENIPEDDPRNAAVIADQVGDNVGDIAGMGSDLFESYVSSLAAAMVIGAMRLGMKGVILPLLLASLGILSSFLASFFVRLPKALNEMDFKKQTIRVHKAMSNGILVANLLMIAFSFVLIYKFLNSLDIFWALLSGLGAGFLIGKVSEYFTSEKEKPVLNIAQASEDGASGVIMEGLEVGMRSTFWPILGVAVAIVLAYAFAGLYGIAIASVGILGVLGINLSTDCYGPIADNAAGIAEMTGSVDQARQRTEALDAVGNSTAAVGKGFAIGAAALAALSWLATYFQTVELGNISFLNSRLIAGLFIGSSIAFLFSALAMRAVSRGAAEIVKEVRRQFREIPGLMAGKARADYSRCVDLTTRRALKEMILPGVLVVLTPILTGVFLGKEAVGGLLAGALVTAFPLALFMANAGGAWDNAKKYIEAGNFGGKGSPAHKAAVVGDTIGDPFKDTAGPSLNILIKLMGVTSLVLIPLLLM